MALRFRLTSLLLLSAWSLMPAASLLAQAPPAPATDSAASSANPEAVPAPALVKVVPESPDSEIASRLERILTATEWFTNCSVQVDQGVAFLNGNTTEAKYRDWAANLAQKTADVVAVVNRIKITERALWDLSPAWHQIEVMGRAGIQGLPLFGVATIVLLLTWLVTKYFSSVASRAIGRRTPNPILQQVGSRAIALPLTLLGIYLALRISGLTQMAATIVGGTGLIGLIIGIAFRDIAENFLASILISMQRPFQLGDLIDVNNVQGIVQGVTTRGTSLMTLDGNHVQIPNSLIYKNVIRNLTANPKLRIQFSYPVPGKLTPEVAQKTAMHVLTSHDAVQKDPEPLVLVDEVNLNGFVLKVYFWIDGHAYSPEKTKSAALRLVHVAITKLLESGGQPEISPARNQRNGNPVRQSSRFGVTSTGEAPQNVGEGNLQSEQSDLEKQAKTCARPEECINLLEDQEKRKTADELEPSTT